MEVDQILAECRQRMDKSFEYFQRELRGIRTGRATTALIDYVKVDYYGSATELRELAAISVPEPTMLLVKPFDPTSAANIVKALETADLGLNPQSEGNAIRIAVPPPSAERRKQLMAQVRKMAEDTRVAVRNERREANRHIDQLVKDKNSHLSEDNAKDAKEDVEKLTKKHIEKVDETCNKKVAEVEEV
ncbi:MAG: ribosome recycling factor [Planctomycetota bacterium]|jgi:ribosome recycling factor